MRLLDPLLDRSILFSFDHSGFRRHAADFDPTDLEVDLSGKSCLVTGANSGIGYQTALALLRRGATVILACRNRERAEVAAREMEEITGRKPEIRLVDVSEMRSVRRLVEEVETPLDVLVHNAGLMPETLVRSGEGVELTAAAHLMGPHLLTARLPLREGARVIWVSSGGMYTQKLSLRAMQHPAAPYNGVNAYAFSKRAQVVLAELWAERLKNRRIDVYAMHPGWADTPAVRSSIPRFHQITEAILRSPAEGADTVIWLATAARAGGRSGLFWFDRQPVTTHLLPWTRETPAERQALWEWCEQVTGNPP